MAHDVHPEGKHAIKVGDTVYQLDKDHSMNMIAKGYTEFAQIYGQPPYTTTLRMDVHEIADLFLQYLPYDLSLIPTRKSGKNDTVDVPVINDPEDRNKLLRILQERYRQVRLNLETGPSTLKRVALERDAEMLDKMVDAIREDNPNDLSGHRSRRPTLTLTEDEVFQMILEMSWFLLHPDRVPRKLSKEWDAMVVKLRQNRLGDILGEIRAMKSSAKMGSPLNFFQQLDMKEVLAKPQRSEALSAAKDMVVHPTQESVYTADARIRQLLQLLHLRKYLHSNQLPLKNVNLQRVTQHLAMDPLDSDTQSTAATASSTAPTNAPNIGRRPRRPIQNSAITNALIQKVSNLAGKPDPSTASATTPASEKTTPVVTSEMVDATIRMSQDMPKMDANAMNGGATSQDGGSGIDTLPIAMAFQPIFYDLKTIYDPLYTYFDVEYRSKAYALPTTGLLPDMLTLSHLLQRIAEKKTHGIYRIRGVPPLLLEWITRQMRFVNEKIKDARGRAGNPKTDGDQAVKSRIAPIMKEFYAAARLPLRSSVFTSGMSGRIAVKDSPYLHFGIVGKHGNILPHTDPSAFLGPLLKKKHALDTGLLGQVFQRLKHFFQEGDLYIMSVDLSTFDGYTSAYTLTQIPVDPLFEIQYRDADIASGLLTIRELTGKASMNQAYRPLHDLVTDLSKASTTFFLQDLIQKRTTDTDLIYNQGIFTLNVLLALKDTIVAPLPSPATPATPSAAIK